MGRGQGGRCCLASKDRTFVSRPCSGLYGETARKRWKGPRAPDPRSAGHSQAIPHVPAAGRPLPSAPQGRAEGA